MSEPAYQRIYKTWGKCEEECAKLRAANADLTRQIEQLSADKERLDLIEENKASLLYSATYYCWTIQSVGQICGNIGQGKNMRDTIDAALGQKGKDEKR